MLSEMTVRELLDALDETDANIAEMRDVIKQHEEWLREAGYERRAIIRALSAKDYEIDWAA